MQLLETSCLAARWTDGPFPCQQLHEFVLSLLGHGKREKLPATRSLKDSRGMSRMDKGFLKAVLGNQIYGPRIDCSPLTCVSVCT